MNEMRRFTSRERDEDCCSFRNRDVYHESLDDTYLLDIYYTSKLKYTLGYGVLYHMSIIRERYHE